MNTIDKATTATLTGLYPGIGFNDFSLITATIRNEVYLACEKLYQAGYRTFLYTLESDYDLIAADRVVLLREIKARSIRLVAVLSHSRPPKRFGPRTADKYRELCQEADEIVDMSHVRYFGKNRCEYLLQNSSHVICMATDEDANMTKLVQQAEAHNIPVTNLLNSLK